MIIAEIEGDFPRLLKKCSPELIVFLYQVAQSYIRERQKQEIEQEKACERKKA